MTRDEWEELVAQVEDHGSECVTYYLTKSDDKRFEVIDIKYEDDEIKVVLE